ncbi:TIGR02594 family protein, partial [Chishuiella sp.]|uniref:TIGR02594 family protein n=1 Tax=Chishuiella sp. TaxID=1969467 RepID=UPI0028A7336C
TRKPAFVGQGEKKKEETSKCPNCNKDITLEELQLIFTLAKKSDLESLLISLNKYRKKFGLDTCARKAHFFAQVIEESGRDLRGALVGESLRYGPQRLAETFDNFRSKYVKGTTMQNSTYMGYKGERLGYLERKKAKPTPDAYKYGKTDKQEPNEGMIAFIAYGNRNGNKTGEDAWNFRGRGLLQITGRDNYKAIQVTINKLVPDSNVDVFKEVPKSGYTPHEAAVTGMAEWIHKNLYSIASQATKDNDEEIVKQIIDKLNSGTRSRAKRLINYRGKSNGTKSEYKPTKEIFKVNECVLLTGKPKQEKKQDGKRAPWMEIAWKEETKNIKETGTNKEIFKFFKGTAYEKTMGTIDPKTKKGINDQTISWCAAFINWVFVKYGYKGILTDGGYDAVRALKWAEWTEGKKILNPVYGAIAVKTRKGGGHVGFVAGEKNGKLIILGGNQSNKLQCSEYNVSDFFAFVIPADYEITNDDYNLPYYEGNPSAKGTES